MTGRAARREHEKNRIKVVIRCSCGRQLASAYVDPAGKMVAIGNLAIGESRVREADDGSSFEFQCPKCRPVVVPVETVCSWAKEAAAGPKVGRRGRTVVIPAG